MGYDANCAQVEAKNSFWNEDHVYRNFYAVGVAWIWEAYVVGYCYCFCAPIQVNTFVGATSQTYELIIYTKGLNHHDKVEIGNPSQCHLLVFYIDLECGWLEKKNATNATSNYTHHPRCHGRAYNLLVSLNISNDCDLK